MAVEILSYANVTVTQGGNDTFAQGTIVTGLSNVAYGWSIREILIEWGTTVATGGAAGAIGGATSMLGVGFSVKTLTALPLATDKSTLFVAKKAVTNMTAVGVSGPVDKVWRYNYDENSAPIWVPDPIYVQNHSAATAQTLVANIRLGYVLTKITDAQKASLLLAALQS